MLKLKLSTLNQVPSFTSQDGVTGHWYYRNFGDEDSTEDQPRVESDLGSGHLELLIRGSGWWKRQRRVKWTRQKRWGKGTVDIYCDDGLWDWEMYDRLKGQN
jgi:hypothetical protein